MRYSRPLILVAAALSLLVSACSQPSEITAPRLELQLGSPETDHAVGVAFGKAGNLYALTEASDSYYSDEPYEAYSTKAIDLHRYDRNGNKLWERRVWDTYCDETAYYPECAELRAVDVATDGDGSAYVMYYYDSGDYCEGTARFYSSVVTKINRSGTPLWSEYVASMSDFFVDTNGNLYVVGNNDTRYNGCEENYVDNDPPYAQVVRKYNRNVNLLWERKLNVGTPLGVTVSGSGSVYVVGDAGMSRYSSGGSLTWKKAGAVSEAVVSGSNLYTRTGTTLRRLDGSGRQLWSRSVMGLTSPAPYRITGDTSGNLYVAGRFTSSSSGEDAFVRKYGGGSSLLWNKGFGTYKYDDARGVATYDGSEIYVAGTTQGLFTEANRSGSGGYLRKMDRSGNRIWTR